MPARTSSPIPAALEQLASQVARITPEDAVGLHRFLRAVPDPHDGRGRWYPAVALLAAAAAAVPVSARSLIAIGEWIADAPQYVLGVLGFTPDPLTGQQTAPHTATVRRLLQRVDGDALDAAISAYL